MTQVTQERHRVVLKLLGWDNSENDHRSRGQFFLRLIAVQAVVSTFGRVAALVAVTVGVVVGAVEVVDGVTLADFFAVVAIVETVLAVTLFIADAVSEQLPTVGAVVQSGTVFPWGQSVGALSPVIVTGQAVAFLL